jgi:hypothetical protein
VAHAHTPRLARSSGKESFFRRCRCNQNLPSVLVGEEPIEQPSFPRAARFVRLTMRYICRNGRSEQRRFAKQERSRRAGITWKGEPGRARRLPFLFFLLSRTTGTTER